jgi:hypothetical protein
LNPAAIILNAGRYMSIDKEPIADKTPRMVITLFLWSMNYSMNSGSRLMKLNENTIILNKQINDVMEKKRT